MTVTRRIRRRGEHGISRKTIARGMPGYSGGPVVTTLVCFVLFRTRGCGCIGHPAFPAPSVLEGHRLAKLGRNAPRERGFMSDRLPAGTRYPTGENIWGDVRARRGAGVFRESHRCS